MSLNEMLEESREDGREEGRAEGRAEEREKAARVFMRHLGITYEKAMQLLTEQESGAKAVKPMRLP